MMQDVTVNGSGLVEILTLNKPKSMIPKGFDVSAPLELMLEGDFTTELENSDGSRKEVAGRNVYVDLKKGEISVLLDVQSRQFFYDDQLYVITAERLRDYFRKNIKLKVKGLFAPVSPWLDYKSWEGIVKAEQKYSFDVNQFVLQDGNGEVLFQSNWMFKLNDERLNKLVMQAYILWRLRKPEDLVLLSRFDGPLDIGMLYLEIPKDYETNLDGKIDITGKFFNRWFSSFRRQKVVVEGHPYVNPREVHIYGNGKGKIFFESKPLYKDIKRASPFHHIHFMDIMAEFARITGNLSLVRSDEIKKDGDTSVELVNACVEIHSAGKFLDVRYRGTLYSGFLDQYPQVKSHL